MKTVLCDASPLIFLAKLDRLDLIRMVLGDQIFVLRLVVDEVCRLDAPPVELDRLNRFMENVEVIAFEESDHPSLSLSRCDRASLAWAKWYRPDWLLADERLLRRVASNEGLSVIGTLGLLFEAARSQHISKEELRHSINGLVGEYGFRISVDLYREILLEIESL